jgi:hypothetical protein
MLILCTEEFLRHECINKPQAVQDRQRLRFAFHLLLPLSFLLRFAGPSPLLNTFGIHFPLPTCSLISIAVFRTTEKLFSVEQHPLVIAFSGGAGYIMCSSFLCVVALWVQAVHTFKRRDAKIFKVLMLLGVFSCYVIPGLLFVLLTIFFCALSPDRKSFYAITHKIEGIYAVLLNAGVFVAFLIYGILFIPTSPLVPRIILFIFCPVFLPEEFLLFALFPRCLAYPQFRA